LVDDNNNNNNKKKGFDGDHEILDKISAATKTSSLFLRTITDFTKWCTVNIESIDLEQCHSIFDDFVKSNEHIIQRINGMKQP
jgi:hypothetical protein